MCILNKDIFIFMTLSASVLFMLSWLESKTKTNEKPRRNLTFIVFRAVLGKDLLGKKIIEFMHATMLQGKQYTV